MYKQAIYYIPDVFPHQVTFPKSLMMIPEGVFVDDTTTAPAEFGLLTSSTILNVPDQKRVWFCPAWIGNTLKYA